MSIDEVVGYTYRSFRNQPVGAPNDILWGDGELFLLISDEGTVTGTLAFPADAGAQPKDFMDLSGSVTSWDQLSLRFVGKGRPSTSIAELSPRPSRRNPGCRGLLAFRRFRRRMPREWAVCIGRTHGRRAHDRVFYRGARCVPRSRSGSVLI